MGLRKFLLLVSRGFIRWRPNNFLYRTSIIPLIAMFILFFLQNVSGIRTVPNSHSFAGTLQVISHALCGIGDGSIVITILSISVYIGSVIFYLLTAHLSRSLFRHPYLYWLGFELATILVFLTEAPIMVIMGKLIPHILIMHLSMQCVMITLLLLLWIAKQIIDTNIISRFNVSNVHIFTVSAVLDTRKLLGLIKFFPLGSFIAQISPVHEGYIYLIHSTLLMILIVQLEIFSSVFTNICLTFIIFLSGALVLSSALAYNLYIWSNTFSILHFNLVTYILAFALTLAVLLSKYIKYYTMVEHFIRSISFMRFLEGASFMGRSSSRLYAFFSKFVSNCNHRDKIPVHRFEASCIKLSIETQQMTTYFNTKIFLFPPQIMLYLLFVYYPLSLLLSFYEYVLSIFPSRNIDLVNMSNVQQDVLLNKEHGIRLHLRGQKPGAILEQFSVHNIRLSRLCELRTNGIDTILDRHLMKMILNFLIERQKRIELSILGCILLLLNDSATGIDDYKELADTLAETGFFRWIDVQAILVPKEHETSPDFFFIPQHLYDEHCFAMHLARKYAVPFSTGDCTEFGQILTLIFTRTTSISHTRVLYSAELTMALDFAWSYFASPWVFIYFGTILEIMLKHGGITGKKRYEERIQQKALQFAVITSKKPTNISATQHDTTTLFNFVSLAGKNLSPAQYFYKTHLFSLFPLVDFKIFELESVYQEVSYLSLLYDVFFPYISKTFTYAVKVQGQGSKVSEFDSAYLQQRTLGGQYKGVVTVPYVPTLYNKFERNTLITVHTYSDKEVFSSFSRSIFGDSQQTRDIVQGSLKLGKSPLRSSIMPENSYGSFMENQRLKYNLLGNSEYITMNPVETSGDEIYLAEDINDGGKAAPNVEKWGTKLSAPIVYDLPPAIIVSRLIKYYTFINTFIGKNTFQRFFFGQGGIKKIPDGSQINSTTTLEKESPYLEFVTIAQAKSKYLLRKKCCNRIFRKIGHKGDKGRARKIKVIKAKGSMPPNLPPHPVPELIRRHPLDSTSQLDLTTDADSMLSNRSLTSTMTFMSNKTDDDSANQSVPMLTSTLLPPQEYQQQANGNTEAGAGAAVTTAPDTKNAQDANGNTNNPSDEKFTVHDLFTSEKLLTQKLTGIPRAEPRVAQIAGVSRDTLSIMTLVVLIDLIENIYTFEAADNNSSILTVGNTGHIFIDTLFKNNFLRLFGLLSGFIINLCPEENEHTTSAEESVRPLSLENHTLLLVLQLIYDEFCIIKRLLSSMNTIRYKDQSILFMYSGFMQTFQFAPKETKRLVKLCKELMPEVVETDTDQLPHLRSFFEVQAQAQAHHRPMATHTGTCNSSCFSSPNVSGINTPVSHSHEDDEEATYLSYDSDSPANPKAYDTQIDSYSYTKLDIYATLGRDLNLAGGQPNENDVFYNNISPRNRHLAEQQIIKRADEIRNASVAGKKVKLNFLPEQSGSSKPMRSLLTYLNNAPRTSLPLYISIIITVMLLFGVFSVIYMHLGDMWTKGLVLSDFLDLLAYKYLHVIRLWSLEKQITSTTRGTYSVQMRKQYNTIASASLKLDCFSNDYICTDFLELILSRAAPTDGLDFKNGSSRSDMSHPTYIVPPPALSFDNATEVFENFFPSEIYTSNPESIITFLEYFKGVINSTELFTNLLSEVRSDDDISNCIRLAKRNPFLTRILQIQGVTDSFWRIQPEVENFVPYISISPSVINQSEALPPAFAHFMSLREYIDVLSELSYRRTFTTENDRFHIKIDDYKNINTPIFYQNIFTTTIQGVKALNAHMITVRNYAVQQLFDFEQPVRILISITFSAVIISILRSIQFRGVVSTLFGILNIYQKLSYSDIGRLANIIRLSIYEFAIKYYDTNALQMVLKEFQANRPSVRIGRTALGAEINSAKTQMAGNSSVSSIDLMTQSSRDKGGVDSARPSSDVLTDIPEQSGYTTEALTETQDSSLKIDNDRDRQTFLLGVDHGTKLLKPDDLLYSSGSICRKALDDVYRTIIPFSIIPFRLRRKLKAIRTQFSPSHRLTFWQRAYINSSIMVGSFFPYSFRLNALLLKQDSLRQEYYYFNSPKLVQSKSDARYTPLVLEAINVEQERMRYRYVAIKRKVDNIRPVYLFILLFLLSVAFLTLAIHVLGSVSTTLVTQTMANESALLLTRKVHFFQHMINYLEAGIWNIRTNAKIPAYKDAFIQAAKHLNVEELERMMSRFYNYNIYSLPLSSLAKILAPCSNILYAILFISRTFKRLIQWFLSLVGLSLLFLKQILSVPSNIGSSQATNGSILYQMDYHPLAKPEYTANTILTYYKLLHYIIDTTNTLLELHDINESDSNHSFYAINYDAKKDNVQHLLRKTLYNSVIYGSYVQTQDGLPHQTQAGANDAQRDPIVKYFSTVDKDITKSREQLQINANKVINTNDFRSLFYLFAQSMEKEFNFQLVGCDRNDSSKLSNFKIALRLYFTTPFTEFMLKSKYSTIQLVNLNLEINYFKSLFSLAMVMLIAFPVLLYSSLYLYWSFHHLLTFKVHSYAFNSHRVEKFANFLIVVGISLAGCALVIVITLSMLNIGYAYHINKEYNIVCSLHRLANYHLGRRRDRIAVFLDQPVAYSPMENIYVKNDSLNNIYETSLSMLYYYGFFIPRLNGQTYYNVTNLQKALQDAAAAGKNGTSYQAEIELYDAMPSYKSADMPVSIQEYVYAEKKLLTPNLPFIRWSPNLSTTKFTHVTVETILSAFYKFTELQSLSTLIFKYLRRYVLAIYPTTAASPANHVTIANLTIQSYFNDLNSATMETEHTFSRLYDGIMSLYTQKQKYYDGVLGISGILGVAATLLTIIALSINVLFALLPVYSVYTYMLKSIKDENKETNRGVDAEKEIPAIQVEMLLEKNGHEINGMYTTLLDEHTVRDMHKRSMQPIVSKKFALLPIAGTKELFFSEIVMFTIIPILVGMLGIFFLWASVAFIFIYARLYSINSYVQSLPLLTESMNYITESLHVESGLYPGHTNGYSYGKGSKLSVSKKIEIKQHKRQYEELCNLYNEYTHLLRLSLELICYGSEYLLKFSSPSVRFDEKLFGFSAEMDSTLIHWNQHESVIGGHLAHRRLYEKLTELRLPPLTKILGFTPDSSMGTNAHYVINIADNAGSNVSFTLGQILNFLVPLKDIKIADYLNYITPMNNILQVSMETFAQQINNYLYDRSVKIIIVLLSIAVCYTVLVIILIWLTGRMRRLRSVAEFGHSILLKWNDPYIKHTRKARQKASVG